MTTLAIPSSTADVRRIGRTALKRGRKRVFLSAHKLAMRLGLFVLPVHYYTGVPNTLELEKTQSQWARKSDLPGIEVDLAAQAMALEDICLPFQAEYRDARPYLEATAGQFGPGYGFIESQALHGVIRSLQPRRIVEVGSGVSTHCIRHALDLNQRDGTPGSLTSIEPYPSQPLRRIPGLELIEKPVQQVPMETFTSLAEGDLLFIDSTHAVRAGGDVNFLILEVLPRLAKGVTVHVHDIYLPYDYQRDLLDTVYHWSETSLLRAYLTQNQHARILFCLSHLHYERQDVLRRVFPSYTPQADVRGLSLGVPDEGYFPSSIYIRTV